MLILQHHQHHQQQTTASTTAVHSSVFTHRPVWETSPFKWTRRPPNQSIHSSVNTTVARTTHYARQFVSISQSRSSSGCQQQGTGVSTGNGSPMVYTANRRAATIIALSGASPELRRGEKAPLGGALGRLPVDLMRVSACPPHADTGAVMNMMKRRRRLSPAV